MLESYTLIILLGVIAVTSFSNRPFKSTPMVSSFSTFGSEMSTVDSYAIRRKLFSVIATLQVAFQATTPVVATNSDTDAVEMIGPSVNLNIATLQEQFQAEKFQEQLMTLSSEASEVMHKLEEGAASVASSAFIHDVQERFNSIELNIQPEIFISQYDSMLSKANNFLHMQDGQLSELSSDYKALLSRVDMEIEKIRSTQLPVFDIKLLQSSQQLNSWMQSTQRKLENLPGAFASYSQMDSDKKDVVPLIRLPISQLLTTTIRQESLPIQYKESWFKSALRELNEALDNEPENSKERLQEFQSAVVDVVQTLPRDWRLAPLLLAIVIFSDAVQHAQFLTTITEDQKFELDILREQLSNQTSSTLFFEELKEDSIALAKEVDNLINQLEEKSEQVSKLNTTLIALGGDLNVDVISELRQEVSSMGRKLADARAEIFRLGRDKENGDPVANSATESLQKEIAALESTQQTVLSALKEFLVEQNYVTLDFANTLSVTNTADFLREAQATVRPSESQLARQNGILQDQIQASQERTVLLQEQLSVALQKSDWSTEMMSQLQSRIDILEDQIEDSNERAMAAQASDEALRNQMNQLSAQVALMQPLAHTADAAGAAAQADKIAVYNDFVVENDDLKQRLSATDERLWEMQNTMQTQLDSANAMIKDLRKFLLVLQDSERPRK